MFFLFLFPFSFSMQQLDDREIVLEAVQKSGWALENAAKPLKGDREIVLEAVRQNGYDDVLQFAAEPRRIRSVCDERTIREASCSSAQVCEPKDPKRNGKGPRIFGTICASAAQVKPALPGKIYTPTLTLTLTLTLTHPINNHKQV
jgi:hypothetical protein